MLKDIITYLTTRMVDNWEGCPIVYDNQPPADHTNDPVWARFTIIPGDQTLIGTGDVKLYEQNIRVRLKILTKPGLGTGEAYELAESFIELFRYHSHLGDGFEVIGRDAGMPPWAC